MKKTYLILALILLLVFGAVVVTFSRKADSAKPSSKDNTSYNSSDTSASAGPIISFNFDDGFLSAYNIAIPILDKAGIKSTQYIITRYFKTKGYMNEQDVLNMQADGQEIGAHTKHHPMLGNITDENVLRDEIIGSKQDLLDIGVKDVSTFAYPYGNYNDLSKKIVEEAGFMGARITQPLYNDRNTDKFLLRRQRVEADTSFAEVKDAIDQTIQKKKWLILVFHRIDEDGNYESARHEMLEQIINYVKSKNISVVTMKQGLEMLNKIP